MNYGKKKIFTVVISLCFLFFAFYSNSFAEIKQSYNFNHIGINEGLSQSTVET